MLKTIVETYPVLPAKDEDARAAARPLGRNSDLYQQVMQGWHEIIRHADETGWWGAAAIEHHWHSEGYEVGPSPGVMNAYWAAMTKNLHVGQLGYVLGTHNPVRVAEEVAVLDHLARGRLFVGLARGYQSRWTGSLGQHFGTRATKSPGAGLVNDGAVDAGFAQSKVTSKDLSDDVINREIFEEHVEIMLKCWKEESFRHKGKNWQIPFPYEGGVDDWPLAKAGVTGKMGAPREIDEKLNLVEACVTPSPFQKPHPPVFLSGSGSPETIQFAARQDFNPVYFCNAQTAGPLSSMYRDTARACGRHYALGEKQAVVRWIYIDKTDEAAEKFVREYETDIWTNLYGAMGRRASSGDPVGSTLASGLVAYGSVDTVRKQLLDQWKILPADYLVTIFHYAQAPLDWVLANMDAIQTHIKPALDEEIHKARRAVAA